MALLRLQLLDPPALSLLEVLREPPPEHFWFTVDCGVLPPPLEALLDAGLLESSRFLELNELHALVARAWLGATVAEVIEKLTASAALPVSGDTQRLLKHDNHPVPSARAAQLVVLAGGPAAMRFISAAIATAGIALVLRQADHTQALQAVVMNTGNILLIMALISNGTTYCGTTYYGTTYYGTTTTTTYLGTAYCSTGYHPGPTALLTMALHTLALLTMALLTIWLYSLWHSLPYSCERVLYIQRGAWHSESIASRRSSAVQLRAE